VRAAAFTRARLDGRRPGSVSGPCSPRLVLPGWPLPSARLVFLRWRHQYYEPVRLPTSVRRAAPAVPRRSPPPVTNPADPVGPLMFRRGLRPRRSDAISHVDGARAAFVNGNILGIFHLSRLNPAPCLAPVYTSDLALPRRPQDSVPTCPLRRWPGGTFTHRHSSAWHDVLSVDGGIFRGERTLSVMPGARERQTVTGRVRSGLAEDQDRRCLRANAPNTCG